MYRAVGEHRTLCFPLTKRVFYQTELLRHFTWSVVRSDSRVRTQVSIKTVDTYWRFRFTALGKENLLNDTREPQKRFELLTSNLQGWHSVHLSYSGVLRLGTIQAILLTRGDRSRSTPSPWLVGACAHIFNRYCA